jgi:HlyD family secretion protein
MAVSKRTRIIGGVAAVLVIGGVVAYSVTKENRNRIPVLTQKVARRDLISTVSASGEIKPKKFVNVAADVSGRITDMYVKEGDTVRRGQMLARIDATRLEAGKEQSEAGVQAARADLARAQADVENARLGYERAKKMRTDQLISDQQYEQADADLKMKTAAVDAQKRRIRQQEAMLASTSDDVRKTVVVAPMNGVVTSLQREQGESVIGAQSFSPTVIMTVGDVSSFEVEIMVDETDIRYVTLSQPAEVRVDALEGVKLKGEVTEIGSSAIPRGATAATTSSSSNTANQAKDFKVTVTLMEPPPTLRSGLNATAEITTNKKEKVLAVPIQAIVVREVNKEGKVVDPAALQASDGEPAGGDAPREKGQEKEGVFVMNAGQVHFRPVKTGIIGETEIEVTEGLQEGDEIVTGSYKTLRTLKDEAKVKIDVKKGGK